MNGSPDRCRGPCALLERSDALGREAELVQIPIVGSKRKGWSRHLFQTPDEEDRVRLG